MESLKTSVRIPKKIKNCPIQEAIVEIRFKSLFPEEMIAGVIYNEFKEIFSENIRLPIADIPLDVRNGDENLMYSPHFRFLSGKYVLNVGPRSFGLICPKEYVGWSNFFKQIEIIFNKFFKLSIVLTPERIGLRYVNFFNNLNIFEKLKFDFDEFKNNNNVFRSEYEKDEFKIVFQLANRALLQRKENGSMFDIDVIYEAKGKKDFDFFEKVNKAHELAEVTFFGMLLDDYIKSFNPEY